MSSNTVVSTRELVLHAEETLKKYMQDINPYLTDPTVQEVMVNSPTNIWIEKSGEYKQLDLEFSRDKLKSAINVIAGLNVKPTKTILDCRLPGLRIAATLPPVSVHGASMSIRRHSSRVFTLDDYLENGSFAAHKVLPRLTSVERPSNESIAQGGDGLKEFLIWMVQSRASFIVSGSTSSGKTALLNALAAHIPAWERVVTIEDTAELSILVLNWVSFEANAAYDVQIRDLVRHSLRYRPNRILVGEIRGAEAFDMLDAYNTGHPGMVSFHSETADLTLYRLENMVRMAPEASNWPLADLRRQIAATFKFVIHASNVQGQRGPVEVMEVLGSTAEGYSTQTLFKKQFSYTSEGNTP